MRRAMFGVGKLDEALGGNVGSNGSWWAQEAGNRANRPFGLVLAALGDTRKRPGAVLLDGNVTG